ncbi:hypothetical protein ACHQM5_018213 [Ranunculus cassubicifolius]
MNSGSLNKLPRMEFFSNLNLKQAPNPIVAITATSRQLLSLDVKLLGWSLLSFVPWAVSAKDKSMSQLPAIANRKYQQQYREPRKITEPDERYYVPPFRPYVAKVPWHAGAKGFLFQLFPRYGHYCGPNWSSGKDGGSLLWDQRPIDWVDFCCYCHDIGYDTDDQAKLLKADLTLAIFKCACLLLLVYTINWVLTMEKPQLCDKYIFGDGKG